MNQDVKFSRFDAADYLLTDEDMTGYLDACSEGDDPAVLIQALAAVARARNMSALARDAGLTRPGLYKALAAQGNPSFESVHAIAKALGLQLKISLADGTRAHAPAQNEKRPASRSASKTTGSASRTKRSAAEHGSKAL